MPYPPYRPEHDIIDQPLRDNVLRGEPRTLTDGEFASRELIGALRGQLGRAQSRIRNLESGIRDALDQLRDEEPAAKRLRLELTANEEAA